jgi:hypothetical protein
MVLANSTHMHGHTTIRSPALYQMQHRRLWSISAPHAPASSTSRSTGAGYVHTNTHTLTHTCTHARIHTHMYTHHFSNTIAGGWSISAPHAPAFSSSRSTAGGVQWVVGAGGRTGWGAGGEFVLVCVHVCACVRKMDSQGCE